MKHSNCERCGRVFLQINSTFCERCAKEEENFFAVLKEYLEENPGSTIAVTAEETGISPKKIIQYLREGRLEMTYGLLRDNPLTCTTCGVSVTVGILCAECRGKLNQNVLGLKAESKKRDKGIGMHSSRKDDGRRR